MDQHPAAIFQDAVKVGRQITPARHGIWRWHTQIGDREMIPVHAACPGRVAKTCDGKQIELRVIDQGQDRFRPPSLYHVQINIEVAVPSRAKDTVALLAGAKGQTEMTVANLQAVDAKGVGCAGSKQVLFFLCRFEFRLRLGYVIFGRIIGRGSRNLQELSFDLIAPSHQIPFHLLPPTCVETDHQRPISQTLGLLFRMKHIYQSLFGDVWQKAPDDFLPFLAPDAEAL